MADLSAYVHFSVVLNKSGHFMQITDNSAYPGGVKILVKGLLSIKQPDGIVVTNTNFNLPDIAWNGSNLNVANKDLRLATDGSFQNGAYTITYTVRAAGFTDTVLVQTFILNYKVPKLVINQNFDVFTPNLSVSDGSNYIQDGLVFQSVQQEWVAFINTVNGTQQQLTGSTQSFDLAWAGQYYDSQYLIALTALPSYQIPGVNPFVTIVDQLTISSAIYAEIPKTIPQLRSLLSDLKTQLDAAMCDCNNYSILRMRYLTGQAILRHMIDRGKTGELSGLSLYVYQLEKLFNNNVSPIYTNTNGVIPPYNWGADGGTSVTVNWFDILNKPSTWVWDWIVGTTGGFPIEGDSVFTDARMANIPVRVFRGGLKQAGFPDSILNSWYVKNLGDGFVTFFPALTDGEVISVETIPLFTD